MRAEKDKIGLWTLLGRPLNQDLKVEAKEAYIEHQPSIDVAEITRRLLSYVDSKHLAGLKTVVLTNASVYAMEKNTTCLGRYVPC